MFKVTLKKVMHQNQTFVRQAQLLPKFYGSLIKCIINTRLNELLTYIEGTKFTLQRISSGKEGITTPAPNPLTSLRLSKTVSRCGICGGCRATNSLSTREARSETADDSIHRLEPA